jgi:predicted Co/Zn/Cd cation transporter (cation efflux family)
MQPNRATVTRTACVLAALTLDDDARAAAVDTIVTAINDWMMTTGATPAAAFHFAASFGCALTDELALMTRRTLN